MSKKGFLSLGARLLLFLIPVAVGSLLVSGSITSLYANRGVDKAMTRLLVYKAEDFVRHVDSQWALLLENDLQSDPAYMASLRMSAASYAVTMLRSEGEWILAVDDHDKIVFSVGALSDDAAALDGVRAFRPVSGGDIHIAGEFAGEERIGFGFNIPALGWDVYVTDLKETYFAESRLVRLNTAILVAITVLVASVFVIWFIRRSLKPLRSVVADMQRIVQGREFGQRVDPVQNDEVGELAREFNQMSDYLEHAIGRLKDAVMQEAEARIEVRNREHETLEVLGRVSDIRDEETSKHTSRVGEYAALLSLRNGDTHEEANLMRLAAQLHDIGKVGIPDKVLGKEGKLNKEEWVIVESHVQVGWEILKNCSSPILRAGADIALSHHERWNGSGYPSGLEGKDIPIRGRITGLVDVFDALITERPYKDAWELDRAVEWITGESGRLFDPELVELFFADLQPVRDILERYGDKGPEDSRISALT